MKEMILTIIISFNGGIQTEHKVATMYCNENKNQIVGQIIADLKNNGHSDIHIKYTCEI